MQATVGCTKDREGASLSPSYQFNTIREGLFLPEQLRALLLVGPSAPPQMARPAVQAEFTPKATKILCKLEMLSLRARKKTPPSLPRFFLFELLLTLYSV